jgi:hypothetical protein
MKLNKYTLKTSSNFTEKKRIVASIDNPVKMLRMFTKDLYKHPLQTAIQEYINNAKDAHIMAKKDCSTIEITAPTMANQNVIIKDFGTGLSPEDIENVFARITASNKDTSDSFNGGFGIGSKSWFAINPSFYVVSTFNGTKTYYEISFTDNIYVDMQESEDSQEPNGVEVILPLADSNQIEPAIKAIKRAIKFWSVRPKTINFELGPLPCVYENKDFKIIAINCKKTDLAVTLGETQYSVNDFDTLNSYKKYAENYSIQIKFEVGEVKLKNSQEVGPDRENFALTMEEHVCKKFNVAVNMLPKILKSLVRKETDLNKIIEMVHTREYPHNSYSMVYKGLPIMIDKMNKLPFDRTHKESWSKRSKISGYIAIDPTVLMIKIKPSLVKLQKFLSGAILGELDESNKFTSICFVNKEGNFDETQEKLYSQFFTIKDITEYNIKLPLSTEDKINQLDPEVNIIERGLKDNYRTVNCIKTYTANKKFKISELNKTVPVISSVYWSGGKRYYEDNSFKFGASVKKLSLEYYVATPENLKIMKHFGFKELTKSFVRNKREQYELKISEEKELQEKSIKRRRRIEAISNSTKNKLKWYEFSFFIHSTNITLGQLDMNILEKFFPEDEILKDIFKLKIPEFKELEKMKLYYGSSLSSIETFSEMYPQETKHMERLKEIKRISPLLFHSITHYNPMFDEEIRRLIDFIK